MKPRPPIAIVGLECMFPGSTSAAGFWQDIVEGAERLSDIPPDHFAVDDWYAPEPGTPDKMYARRGGFLSEVSFPALEFGLPPQVAPATDSAQLLALLVARRILDEVLRGASRDELRARTSVVLGVGSALELTAHMIRRLEIPTVLRAVRRSGASEDQVVRVRQTLEGAYLPWQENTFPGLLANVVSGRIANRLDLGGSNFTVDAACASALAAVRVALDELYLGDADLVVTGGVDTFNDTLSFMCFAQTGALSRGGVVRTFDEDADGTMLSEGVGMIALKRVDDAERDGDRIHAVIRGLGAGSDGRARSIYAPRPAGQALAVRRAYQRAGYDAATVGLVEAHGTATRAGDAAELESLGMVFEHAPTSSVTVGSVKSQIGHTKAAAGIAGLIKVVLALQERTLPPTVGVRSPNPALGLGEGPFRLTAGAEPWVHPGDHPRRGSVSSFGFGGTNFHVTMEAYTGPHAALRRGRPRSVVMALSASSPTDLARQARDRAGRTRDLSFEAQRSLEDFDVKAPFRLAVVASSVDALQDRLRMAGDQLTSGGSGRVPGVWIGEGTPGPVAALFPGQGSQRVGMGGPLARFSPMALDVWDRVARETDFAAHRWVFPGFGDAATQEARLRATEVAQPAITTASGAAWAGLHALGVPVTAVAGHSLGELGAAAAAGVWSWADAVKLARRRGEAMAEAAADTPGAMLAVRASLADVEARLVEHPDLGVANHNGPDQVVVSGPTERVEAFERACVTAGLVVQRLPVSTAFHSPLVAGAATRFRAVLDELEPGSRRLELWSNQGDRFPDDTEGFRARLADQIAAPVRFVAQIEAMWDAGVRVFVELGPGAALSRLVSAILADRPHTVVSMDGPAPAGPEPMGWLQGVAQLAAAGVARDVDALWEGFETIPDPDAAPVPELTLPIRGVNYGKPPPIDPTPVVPPPVDPAPAAPSAPAAPAQAPGPAPAPVLAESLEALHALQAPLLAAHAEHQRVLAESHRQFLETIAATYQVVGLGEAGGLANGAGVTSNGAALPPAPPPSPPPARTAAPPLPVPPPPATVPAAVPAPVPVEPPRAPVSAPAAPRGDLGSLLREVVSEKTGYPPELLKPDMALEADLGIDSIKRVEILAAMRDRVPELAELDPQAASTLNTLGDVVHALQNGPVAAAPVPAPSNGRDAARPPVETRPLETPAPAVDLSGTVQRTAVRWTASPRRGLVTAGLASSPVCVTPPSHALAAPLAAALDARGLSVRVGDPADAEAVIWVGGVGAGSTEDALKVQQDAFAMARRLAGRAGPAFVLVWDVADPWRTGLAGLARTAQHEWSDTTVRAIELQGGGSSTDETAAMLADELLRGGGDPEVRLAAGERFTPQREPAPLEGVASPLPADAPIVVTGGARGVTARVVEALVDHGARRILLLGRTLPGGEAPELAGVPDEELPAALLALRADGEPPAPKVLAQEAARIVAGREVQRTVSRLRDRGAEVRYASVDVRDREAVGDAVGAAREAWGPIRDVVHGAGVLADAAIADVTDEAFARVFDTKVGGLRALLDAVAEDPIERILLFSSVAGRVGNPGQAPYAMANATLDAVAAHLARERPEARIVSIAFGPWDGGMVGTALARLFEERGVALLPLDAGAEAACREWTLPHDGVVDPIVTAGAGLVPPARRRARVTLGGSAERPLADHQIRGATVVPLALAGEWFARFAPFHGALTLFDLQVLRGVTWSGECPEEDGLDLDGEPDPRGFAMTLRDGTGAARYTAVAAPGRGTEPLEPLEPGGEPPELEAYGSDGLFHGPLFHAIDEIEALQPSGVDARIRGIEALGWPGGWRTDVAALDGALQLAWLWTSRELDAQVLPLRVEEVQLPAPGPHVPPHRARARIRSRRDDRVIADADVLDEGGNLIAAIRGAELYVVPGGTAA